ncbi:unnamed protein product [Sphagnum compactum]
MADTAVEVPAAEAPAKTPAKKTKAKAAGGLKKPKAKPTHPPVAQMIVAAVKELKDRKGSSLAAIKKYIAANNKCDVAKLAPFIKKGIKSLVVGGKLVQTKGKGASGSFKLPVKEKKEKAAKPKAAAKKAKKPAKKSGEKKVKATKAKAAKKAGTAKPKQKATKPKAAAKKPKTPKPKKAPAKKAAPKKK